MKAINKNIYIFVLLVITVCLQNNLFACSKRIPSFHTDCNKHLFEQASFFVMENSIEIWKDIPGFENRYQSSTFGIIKSLKCELGGSYKNKKPRNKSERILKPWTNKKGYFIVGLGEKKGNRFLIHRLVAITFIPNPDNKPFINHKDGNKSNNKVENLEWVTAQENTRHAFDSGLHKNHLKGENAFNAILTNKKVLEIRKMRIDGFKNHQICKKYGLTKAHISNILNNRCWKSV